MSGDVNHGVPSRSRLPADLISQRGFTVVRRGFDQNEVRAFLDQVSAEVRSLHTQLDEMAAAAAAVPPPQPAERPPLDEENVVALVGEETANVLRAARSAASELRRKAESEAERIVDEARQLSGDLRQAAEAALAAAHAEGQAASEAAVATARAEAEALMAKARSDADGLREQAEQERRLTIEGAQAVREKILADLSRRRRVATVQIEQLRAGRERLLSSYAVVRRTLEEVHDELQRADAEARAAADEAGRRAEAEPSRGDSESAALAPLPDVALPGLVAPEAGGVGESAPTGPGPAGASGPAPAGRPPTPPAPAPPAARAEAAPAPAPAPAPRAEAAPAPAPAPRAEAAPAPATTAGAPSAPAGAPERPAVGTTAPAAPQPRPEPAAKTPPARPAEAEPSPSPAGAAGGDRAGSPAPVPAAKSAPAGPTGGGRPAAPPSAERTEDRPAGSARKQPEARTAPTRKEEEAPSTAPGKSKAASPAATTSEAARETRTPEAAPAARSPEAAKETRTPEAAPEPAAAEQGGRRRSRRSEPDEETRPAAPPRGMEPVVIAEDGIERVRVLRAEAGTKPPSLRSLPGGRAGSQSGRQAPGEGRDTEPAGKTGAPEPAGRAGGAEPEARAGEAGEAENGVDGLFARIRAGREASVDAANRVLEGSEAPAGDEQRGTRAEAAEDGAEAAEDGGDEFETPRSDEDEAALQRRDQLIGSVEAGLTKKLKRVLQDEQNELLDRLRSLRGAPKAATLLPDNAEQTSRVAASALPLLEQAESAGAKYAGVSGAPRPQAAGEVADGMASALVAPLRRRLADAVRNSAGDDQAVLVEAIGTVYREWKTQKVEPAVLDAVTTAFAKGSFAATPSGTEQRWVVEDTAGPCPDCDDNALAGYLPKGEEFPTGQLHPPAHAGCRCVLAPAGDGSAG